MPPIFLDKEQGLVEQALQKLSHDLHATSWRAVVQRRLLGSWPSIRGLYIWGSVGRGKTLLMDRFFESLNFSQKKRIHFHAWMRSIHAALEKERHHEDPLARIAEKLSQEYRVLCLDEFFVSDIGDAMILSGLLSNLLFRGVTLVTTSNTALFDLYPQGLQRDRFLPAIAILARFMDMIEIGNGQDYRLKVLKEAAVYWTPLTSESDEQMKQVFFQLTNGQGGSESTIEIMGRSLHARCRFEGVICFDFSELCETARSVSDYLELSELYHTVFVRGVPLLTNDKEEAARRWIYLVDTFYDRRVKLLLTVAVPVVDLYQGERWKMDFKRTISRLIEMKSEQYLCE